jgi:hypothetical protein
MVAFAWPDRWQSFTSRGDAFVDLLNELHVLGKAVMILKTDRAWCGYVFVLFCFVFVFVLFCLFVNYDMNYFFFFFYFLGQPIN